MTILQTHNLTKIYNGKVIAVNGVNLSVPKGTVFGLLGPNGAGKTTTLKMMVGLQRPTAGWVEVFGQPMTPNAADLRQRIGYLPTNPSFPGHLTPVAYLDLVGQLYGIPKDERINRLASLIRAVGLLSAQSQPIKTFSTGMTTRLGIAASLINDPDLLIWDEPAAGLDPAGRKYTLDLIAELGKTKTIIFASHILSDIERVCDYVAIIYEGKIIFQGPMKQFKQAIRSNSVELELDGATVAMTRFFQRLQEIPEVATFSKTGSWVEISFQGSYPLASSLAKVLSEASAAGVEVLTIVSSRAQTEEAYLHFLEVDRSYGFLRASRDLPSVATGLQGSSDGGTDLS